MGTLPSLKKLYLISLRLLERLPISIGGLTRLEDLRLESVGLTDLPQSTGQLRGLKTLAIKYLRCDELELPETMTMLKLEVLHVSYVDRLKNLPQMNCLRELTLSCVELRNLSDALSGMTSLEILTLDTVYGLQVLS